MKKVLFLALMILAVTSVVSAEPISLTGALEKLPSLKSGVAYSILDGGVNQTQTFEVVSLNKYLTIDAGYAGDSEPTNHKFVVGLSLNLIESGSIQFPILKYVSFKPQVLFGLGNINAQEIDRAEHDILVGAKVLEWKF